MSLWQGLTVAFVALFGAGGPVAVWVATRDAKREAAAAAAIGQGVAASIGPKNGHGTVQDQTGELLSDVADLLEGVRRIEGRMDRFERSTATSLDSIVGAAALVNERLKAHDREIAALKKERD